MTVIVDFLDKNINFIEMEGPNMDYVFKEGFLVVTSNKFSEEPEKRVTIPVDRILKVTEHNN